MDLIMGKHGVEEIRKGGNQSRPQGVGEESDLRDDLVEGGMGRGPSHRPSTLVEAGGEGEGDFRRA